MGVKKTDPMVFYKQAEKMIPWSLTFEEWSVKGKKGADKFIEVPQEEWDQAREDLTCRLLIRDHGFVIRACIPVEKKEVFNPEIRLKYDRPKQAPVSKEKTGFEVGNRFRVVSTKTALEITEAHTGGRLTLKYVDGTKLPFPSSIELIKTQLNRQTWIRM